MTELGDIFAELGVSQYLNDFVEQGFDSWDTILDITETDFDALGVKLGHRRKLQRRIANSRGLSSDKALETSTRNTPTDDRPTEEQRTTGTRVDPKETGAGPQGAKRKYRRHPKPDENAPERPPSAYVIFSNKMREELKGRNLSFTEIAKLVGENWQALIPTEKEPYEQAAFTDKERYNSELAEYKKTPQHTEYAKYLAEFKARQSSQQQVTDLDAKRPKLEAHPSTASNGTVSSGTSQHGIDPPSGRPRVGSSASNTGQWVVHNSQLSPRLSGPSIPESMTPTSPLLTSQTILPGYRESIYGNTQQTLSWRDGNKDDGGHSQLPRINNEGARRSSQSTPTDPPSFINSQHAHRTNHPPPAHAPPLLTQESTAGSTSTTSSTYYSPRTSLEPAIGRSLPIPSLYPQKSPGPYESQLPPLHPPSLSPQNFVHTQQSPDIHSRMEFPMAMAPMRGYPSTGPQQISVNDKQDDRFRNYGSSDDAILDPVSALLRAGEIVDRDSQGRR